jgi:transcriptional regulator PpsR
MGSESVVMGDSVPASVLTSVADVYVVLSPEGNVKVAVARPETMAIDEVARWVGGKMVSMVDAPSARKLQDRLKELSELAATGKAVPPRWVELMHEYSSGQSVPVRYAMHWRPDDKDVLMLGQDQRPIIEMQQQLLNAQIALERDYEAQREIDTRYRILMDFTSEAILLVSMASSKIVDINHNAASFLGATRADLIDKSLGDCFVGFRKEDLIASLESPTKAVGVISAESKTSSRRFQLSGKLFRASGEQLVMLRIVDNDLGSIGDGRLVTNLRMLFQRGIDAIVFTDRDGNILSASETFLNLTDSTGESSVRGRSMADFLARGTVDLRMLIDNARRAGHLRMYATKVKTDFGAQIGVEISATWLADQLDPMLALVIRNSATASALRNETVGPDTNPNTIIELVGSSTLKDIVSETTDVIEKICIETAIELTRNNRVAAAEMLGLSRQSLYVKLRKYGLISKDET